jgi:ribosome-associated heat shock protein Hsp15
MRLDKWLWAARFFKTRGLARAAVEGGKVRMCGERVKPAKEIAVGNLIEIGVSETTCEVRVAKLGERRGPAHEARQLFEETPDSLARRQRVAARIRLAPEPTSALRGRPTKKDRRALDRFRGQE